MYSRDIFPKYTSGGLPIPENYSGNAIRRVPQVHTPAPRTNGARTVGSGVRAAEVPLSVTPSFAAQNARREEPRTDTAEDTPPMSMRGEDIPPPREENGAGDDRSPDGGGGLRGGGGEPPRHREEADRDDRVPLTAPTSAHGQPPRHHESGLGSLLSGLLPPKFGGGALSQVGLEEALLLGLFLLLSQSEEEDDTLMLLALLFLYR